MTPALALCLCLTDLPVETSDLARFPMLDVADSGLAYSRDQCDQIGRALRTERTDPGFWRDWLAISERQREAWYQLSCAHHPEAAFTDSNQCFHLRKLREQIGLVDYYAGRMPPAWSYAPRLYAPWIR